MSAAVAVACMGSAVDWDTCPARPPRFSPSFGITHEARLVFAIGIPDDMFA